MSEAPVLQAQHLKTACSNCSVLELCLPIGMNGAEVARLDTLIVQRVKVKKGAALYRTGNPLRSLYAVRIGSFKTSMLSVDGREQVTGFHIPGEMLGLDAISADEHACNAFALEDSEVCPIHFAQLEKLAQSLPSLQHNLNRLLSREIVRDHSMLMLMGNMNSDERLAAFLLNLSQRLSLRGYSAKDFVLKMRREEIGSYLGLRLETICRASPTCGIRSWWKSAAATCGSRTWTVSSNWLPAATAQRAEPIAPCPNTSIGDAIACV